MKYRFKMKKPVQGPVNIAKHVFVDGVMDYESSNPPVHLARLLSYYGVDYVGMVDEDSTQVKEPEQVKSTVETAPTNKVKNEKPTQPVTE